MKKSLIKLSLIPAGLVMMATLSGCVQMEPSATARYTGTAVVKSHYVTGSSCNARVEVEGGKTGTVTMGKKADCSFLRDGTKIKMENGKYRGKVL